MKPASSPSLKARALRCLALREHSRAELERKLARHADADGQEEAAARIARVLDELAALGLLDDMRAAQAMVSAQAARCGELRLRQTLRARGLAPEVAASALASVATTEFERAQALWKRRFGQVAADAAERARQARFLAGRGFGADVIRRVVRGLDEH